MPTISNSGLKSIHRYSSDHPTKDLVMPGTRSNQEWLDALSNQGIQQEIALEELRRLLLRAALFTLVTHLADLHEMPEEERLALAEECAQEAMMTVLVRLGDFRGDSKFTTWAYKFGINIALSRARRWRWKQVSLDDLADDDGTLNWFQRDERLQTADSEQPVRQREVVEVIREVLRTQLTARQRQTLKLIAFDNVPMDVVVQRLDSNRNAVYKLLHDARLKIKQQLVRRGYDLAEVMDLFQ
ncbi:MAG: sigma-70 family RNA polymerase sigma factor [Chloroflexi bacterium]|nr:MAG: sigma-70 family RNA polymerase sigma factor [Chloroflexota bacterium]